MYFYKYDSTSSASEDTTHNSVVYPKNRGATGAWLLFSSMNFAPSTSPKLSFLDDDSTNTNKTVGQITVEYVDGSAGSANADICFKILQNGDGTSMTSIFCFDESDDRWETTKDVSTTADFHLLGDGKNLQMGADKDVYILHDTDDGVTIGVANNTNNESINLDFETTADTIEVTSPSGATAIDINTLDLISTGKIYGAINIITTTDGDESPTAAQMYGTMFIADNATAANDTDYTLPTAAAGMSACFYDYGAGTGGIIVDAAASDEILLNGAGIGVAEAIDSPGVAGDGANGDFICIMAIDDTYWVTMGASGTWVDGGTD
jgi:hypothetical protein